MEVAGKGQIETPVWPLGGFRCSKSVWDGMGHMGWDHHTPLAWTVNTTRAPAGLIVRSGKGYSFASLSPIRLKHIVPCQL